MGDPLIRLIVEEIQSRPKKTIPFRRFMELALYHPRWGYYRRRKTKIGRKGDFYTSPAVGEAFGWTLARAVGRMARTFPSETPWLLAEAGAGDGSLAARIVQALAEEGRLPRVLYLVETSPYHRELQQNKLVDSPVPVRWTEEVRDLPMEHPSILLSNELLDAFPVHRVIAHQGELREIYVTWDAGCGELAETSGPLSRPELADYFREQKWNLPDGWIAEVPLDALEWVETAGRRLKAGYLLTIDYGGTTEELALPRHKDGTLRCFHRHRLHRDFYTEPGRSDMTSHVHFSALMARGRRVGLQTLLYTTQSRYLQGAGILSRLTPPVSSDPFAPEAKRNRAIRHLALPGGMGDDFRVLVQCKGVPHPVNGMKDGT
ncbi:SAM-dependent MidA family methyltransferase [Melghirimyces profundicolus]|uniref:SAM-dependent MidA family methyltransferase n=1 Tax=Melghirimyces profundicolus TaxID=1242148 RepID=A0A2T6C9S1_9BACL|nr:SAM-dependent methyltransferase [Melghirimyces profundicolus]PTX65079.1 SAM-dependent MidA family methyltransferase [Melghirimyces profundicolus]